MKRIIIIALILFFGISNSAYSQSLESDKDTAVIDNAIFPTDLPLKRNVLKWNLTPMIWSIKNVNLSYERVTSSHGSFSVNAGYFILPLLGGSIADSFE